MVITATGCIRGCPSAQPGIPGSAVTSPSKITPRHAHIAVRLLRARSAGHSTPWRWLTRCRTAPEGSMRVAFHHAGREFPYRHAERSQSPVPSADHHLTRTLRASGRAAVRQSWHNGCCVRSALPIYPTVREVTVAAHGVFVASRGRDAQGAGRIERAMTSRMRRALALVAAATALGLLSVNAWIHLADSPTARTIIRLYGSPTALRAELARWGASAPVVFVVIQALQVLIAPIPGELTGFLGGFVFGQRPGCLYSMLGLSLGSFLAFGIGRWLGAAFVQRLVSPDTWRRLGFVVEAGGVVLCFVLFLIPGFPKDILCYLF